MDPIANALSRIMNAQAVYKDHVKLPYSQIVFEIFQILERNGYMNGVEKRGDNPKKSIIAHLKYVAKTPIIRGVRRLSKPGVRLYESAADLKKRRSVLGVIILSTSKGIMTDAEARKQNIGGEVLCKIW